MSTAEIKNAIIGKVLSIEDEQLLNHLFVVINKQDKPILDAEMQAHLDKILSEDYHLLHRLAQ